MYCDHTLHGGRAEHVYSTETYTTMAMITTTTQQYTTQQQHHQQQRLTQHYPEHKHNQCTQQRQHTQAPTTTFTTAKLATPNT
jgi:hypothetical protein